MPEAGLFFIFGTSFLVGLTGAVSPGPLLAFNIRETAHHGFWAGPFVATGHSLLELVIVALLVLGLGPFLQKKGVSATVGVLGGLFLLWMAWGMFRNPGKGAPHFRTAVAADPGHPGGTLVGGALVSLSNPYWFLWWMTAGAALLTRSYELGLVGIAAFYVGHILADYAWYALVSAAIAGGRRLMTPAVYKGIILVCAVFLLAMGVYFLVSGTVLLTY